MKSITTKIILTIPALIIGILSAIAFILKPLIELWTKKDIQEIPPVLDETDVIEQPPTHQFH